MIKKAIDTASLLSKGFSENLLNKVLQYGLDFRLLNIFNLNSEAAVQKCS